MYKLQSPNEFLADLIAEINQAKEEINIESMLFESGEILSQIIDALVFAAERGVKVEVAHDWVSQKYVHGNLPLISIPMTAENKYARELHEKNFSSIKKLIDSGKIIVREISKPGILMSLIPFVGRNHMKIYRVDQSCWIGGINISDESFRKIDFMVKIENLELSKLIGQIFENNINNRDYSDLEHSTGDMSLLVDSGKIRKSIIYRNAIEAVSSASQSIMFMSQFLPDNKILEIMIEKSKLNTTVDIFTSGEENSIFTKYPERISYLNFKKKTKDIGNIKLHHLDKDVHAKLLIVDAREAIFGSHNLVIPGVMFGTKEIAVRTSNRELIKDLLLLFLNSYKLIDSSN